MCLVITTSVITNHKQPANEHNHSACSATVIAQLEQFFNQLGD